MNAAEHAALALTVQCPTCGVKPAERCRTSRRTDRAEYHAMRLDRALDRNRRTPRSKAIVVCHRETTSLNFPYDTVAEAFDAAWTACDGLCLGSHLVTWTEGERIRVKAIDIRVPPPSNDEADRLTAQRRRERDVERLRAAGRDDLVDLVESGGMTSQAAINRARKEFRRRETR